VRRFTALPVDEALYETNDKKSIDNRAKSVFPIFNEPNINSLRHLYVEINSFRKGKNLTGELILLPKYNAFLHFDMWNIIFQIHFTTFAQNRGFHRTFSGIIERQWLFYFPHNAALFQIASLHQSTPFVTVISIYHYPSY
jgi:hypothetical protein